MIARAGTTVRQNALFFAVWFALAGVLFLAATLEANRQEQARVSAFRNEIVDLAQISEVIMAGRLRAYDDTLLVLRKYYVDDPARFDQHVQRLRSGPLADRDLLVVVVDREGFLAFTDTPNVTQRLALGDRAYFRYFAEGGADRYYIDEPTFGRTTQRYSVPLVRPIYDKTGKFQGVVGLSVKQDSLADFGPKLRLFGDTTVTVVTQNGSVVTRSHDLTKAQGTKVAPQLLAQFLQKDEGVFSSNAMPDGMERTIAYRHIAHTPLIIYVAASAADVLHVTSQQRAVLLACAGLASFLALLLLVAYLQHQKITAKFIAAQQVHVTELEASNRELEAFSYSISHDLRAPLRAIHGYSHLLKEEYGKSIGSDGQHYLARIGTASEHMGAMIDDLLELSRVARQELNREPVNLGALGEAVLTELMEQEPNRVVTWDIAPNLTAQADAVLIRILVDNLLRNAWKFTSEQPQAHIEFFAAEVAGERRFCVRDNGVGFDPAYGEQLFKPFHRLHDAKRFEGTGIGLTIVERVARRHGGRVWAESKPGAGASFYFTLP
jgi:signal transduction histidine kinase